MRSDVFADDDWCLCFDSPSSLFELRRARFALRPSRGCTTRSPKGEAWWSQTGSNRRPHACKARALPAELWPRNQKTNAHSMSVVGLGRLELPTSRLSSARSNQLSYKPLTLFLKKGSGHRSLHRAQAPDDQHKRKPLARVRPRRKRNVDGEIPPMQLNNPDDRWPLMFLKRFDRSKLLKNHP